MDGVRTDQAHSLYTRVTSIVGQFAIEANVLYLPPHLLVRATSERRVLALVWLQPVALTG